MTTFTKYMETLKGFTKTEQDEIRNEMAVAIYNNRYITMEEAVNA